MNLSERLGLGRNFLDTQLFVFGGAPITLATLVIFLLILAITFVASKALQKAVSHALAARGAARSGSIRATLRLLHYSTMSIGTAIALDTIGIDLAALFAAGAIFAIAIGFAMQNIAQNFVSGVILLVERTIKPGDVLRVDGQLVRVEQMGIRATIAKTLDNEEIIIPNSNIVQGTVTNYTLEDSIYRLRCKVGVTYSSDMAEVKRVLQEAGQSIKLRDPRRAPLVLMTEFGDSSVNFEVSVWMDDPWRVRRAQSELNEAIWWGLKKAGITIAFPQLDVHFDPPVMEGLARARESRSDQSG